MKEKWYNNRILMQQLAIIPPIMLYGLYFSIAFKTQEKKAFVLFYIAIGIFLCFAIPLFNML